MRERQDFGFSACGKGEEPGIFFGFGAVFFGREKSGVGVFFCREDGFRAER